MTRELFLVFYDIADPKRLTKAHARISAYSVSFQKSFFECWMTKKEVRYLTCALENMMDPDQDRVHILQLDPRRLHLCVGRGRKANPEPFIIM